MCDKAAIRQIPPARTAQEIYAEMLAKKKKQTEEGDKK
jgi:hypothetical protein